MAQTAEKNRVSIRDIAREADVSAVTVANALRGRKHQMSPNTYEHVLRIARQMNYIPVPQPVTQRRHAETRVIGLSFDDLDWMDYWGLETYRGLRHGAKQHGYDLLALLQHPMPEWEDKEELRYLDRRCDGIVFTVRQVRTEILAALGEQQIPAVSCYIRDVPETAASVTLDDYGAMRALACHLIEMGHTQTLFLGWGLMPRPDYGHRLEGYSDTVKQAGLEPHHLLLDELTDWTSIVLEEIERLQPTAILCVHDPMALALRTALQTAGYRVPEDISLVGMDNLAEAAAAGLTTVSYSCLEVGRLAIEAMVQLIKTGEVHHYTVPVELVVRNSVARVE